MEPRRTWTPEQHAALAKGYNEGRPLRELAAELGTTEQSCKFQLHKHLIPSGAVQRRPTGGQWWTPERDDQLAALWATDRGKAQIARELGTTVGRLDSHLQHTDYLGGRLARRPLPYEPVDYSDVLLPAYRPIPAHLHTQPPALGGVPSMRQTLHLRRSDR